jgi:hypothetical protein
MEKQKESITGAKKKSEPDRRKQQIASLQT